MKLVPLSDPKETYQVQVQRGERRLAVWVDVPDFASSSWRLATESIQHVLMAREPASRFRVVKITTSYQLCVNEVKR